MDEPESVEETLGRIADAYIDALDRGERPDREALIVGKEHLRSEILAELDRIDVSPRVERPIVPLRSMADIAPPRPELPPRYEPDTDAVRPGGMGIVQRVFDRRLGRSLAVKWPQLQPTGPDGRARDLQPVRERFAREVAVTARLEHPGVLPVHEFEVDSHGTPYFLMPWLGESKTLALELRRANGSGRPRWGPLLRLFERVCETVAFAHAAGVIHRDLKPSNIGLGTFGRVFVLDWGLARARGVEEPKPVRGVPASLTPSQLSVATPVLGTPGYMSPEAVRGDLSAMGPWSDVWSLGTMLFEILTGAHPPSAGSPSARLEGRSSTDPRTLDPTVPADLAELCVHSLAESAEKRLPDAESLVAGLRAWRLREAAAQMRRRALRQRRRLFRGGAALLVVFATVAVMTFLESRQARRLAALVQDAEVAGQLEADRDKLWPLSASTSPLIANWLRTAEGLVSRADLRRAELHELRADAEPYTAKEEAADHDDERLEKSRLETAVGITKTELSRLGTESPALGAARARLERTVASYVRQLDAVEERLQVRERWTFEEPELRWRHERSAFLVERLDRLAAPSGWMADMRERLALIARVDREPSAEEAHAWADAARAVAASPPYGGLRLTQQRGLLPLGADPKSGHQEFAVLETGRLPARDRSGNLERDGETAMVLVLLPARRFLMGAQPDDPSGSNFDGLAEPKEGPPRSVTLGPYFLSKYECSQAHWARMTGGLAPSYVRRESTDTPRPTELHPVENVDWLTTRLWLERWRLRLPTEAEWECACRAGTTTPWSAGAAATTLDGVCNLADRAYVATRRTRASHVEAWLDDGFALSSPIGSFAANAYGLHDMHGNVAEWCWDFYDDYLPQPEIDPRGPEIAPEEGQSGVNRVLRGGQWSDGASAARSAARHRQSEGFRSNVIGVRPARSLE